ncbi:MAG: hypothetical protein IPK76_19430 [Lewinellaceae bacterium]|nr:hypothetical protein [Lewinellaceae bacterium]
MTDGGALQYRQEYVGGIEYRYTTAGGTVLEAIYHAEGRVYNNGGTLRYEYVIRDHLGNTRLTFTDKNGNGVVDVTNTASNEILQENHFYPFGLDMAGPWMNDAAQDNLYKYNGKELNGDFGLNWMDYGARWYDGSVGRWWCVDPLVEVYPTESGFVYGGDSPIAHVDLGGFLKYPSGSDYEQYKTLTEFLSGQGLQDILKDPDISSGLRILGNYTDENIVADILTWGEGIEIVIRDTPCGYGLANGCNTSPNENTIEINIELVKQLESATLENREAALLAIVSTILHEAIHYGRNRYENPSKKRVDGNFSQNGNVFKYKDGIIGTLSDSEHGNIFEAAVWNHRVVGTTKWGDESLEDFITAINTLRGNKEASKIPKTNTP